jgi:hypothetical protein
MGTSGNHVMQIREATAADQPALGTLALLDSRPRPRGRALVAVVDGRIEAALAVDSGRAIADPFERTAELVSLLETRAAQLRAA